MYLTITRTPEQRDPKIEKHEGKPSLEDMQKIVGGYVDKVTLAFDPSTRRAIDAWVHDEGLLLDLPLIVFPQLETYSDRLYLAGPVVIAGADVSTGETVPLTEVEIDRIKWLGIYEIGFQSGQMVPVFDVAPAKGRESDETH